MSAPRGIAPSPHQPHPAPLLRPTVPQPSMFFPELPSHTEDSLLAPCPLPPRPSAPSTHLLRPQSDFSRLFHHSEATLFLQGSDSSHFELFERRVQFNSVESPRHQQLVSGELPLTKAPLGLPTRGSPGPQPTKSTPGSSLTTSASCPALRGPHESPQTPTHGAPPLAESPHLHPDLVQMLAWQNDQLKKLQEQVAALLAESPRSSPHTPPAAISSQGAASPLLRRPSKSSVSETGSTSHVLESKPASPASAPKSVGLVSTNTVSTNTSLLWPDIQRGLARLQESNNNNTTTALEELRQSEVQVTRDESSASPQPSVHIDLPDYNESPGEGRSSATRPGMSSSSWSSPVLGESISMYETQSTRQESQEEQEVEQEVEQEEQEEQEVAELYKNILGQVKKLLVQEETTSEAPGAVTVPLAATKPSVTPSSTASAPTPGAPTTTAPDPKAATLEQLRQMGVSFISPADLAAPTPSSVPQQSVYLPSARLPSQSVLISPDTSLDISSLALKYLGDQQLCDLAARHQAQQGKKQVRWGEAPGQLSSTELSVASHQFLARHGLGDHSLAAKSNYLIAPQPQPVTAAAFPLPVEAIPRQLEAVGGHNPPCPPPSPVVGEQRGGQVLTGVKDPVLQGLQRQPVLPHLPLIEQQPLLLGQNLGAQQATGQQGMTKGGQSDTTNRRQNVHAMPHLQPANQLPPPSEQQLGHLPPHVGGPTHRGVGQPMGVPFGQTGPGLGVPVPQPLTDRVLDITAIRQQPKLL